MSTAFGPLYDQPGANFDTTGEVYGDFLGAGVYPWCTLCGGAVFCGGPKCPNQPLLPLAPDQVPMVQETFQSVQVWNAQQGQASGDGATTVPGLITQVA